MSQDLNQDGSFSSGSGTERRDRSDKVSQRLARRILRDTVTRHLEPGTKLPSEALMLERYKVGRASLREGLRILEVYGLIWIKPGPGGGPVVADVNSIDFARSATFFYHAVGATLNELVEARLHLEPLMARLAAERLTDQSAEGLRHALAREQMSLEMNDPTTQPTPQQADDAIDWWPALFHKVVGEMSGNRVMGLFGQSVVDIYVERVSTVSAVDRRSQVHTAHGEIGTAILKGQAQKAERLMHEHMEEVTATFAVRFPGLADEIIDWR
jgi:GntR family transcriptional regulator, transcriptional repressor for pyruvate dehydrogenase complex